MSTLHLLAVAGGGGGGGGAGGTASGHFGGWPMVIIGVVMAVIGALWVFAPRAMFRMGMFGHNWQFAERPQPSAGYMSVQRVSGVIGIVAGVAVAIFGLVRH